MTVLPLSCLCVACRDDVARAVRRRLKISNPRSAWLAAHLFDTLAKNAGIPFLTAFAPMADALGQLAKTTAAKKNRDMMDAHEKTLELVQTMGEEFLPLQSSHPALAAYVRLYHQLRLNGMEFPRPQMDDSAPKVFNFAAQKLPRASASASGSGSGSGSGNTGSTPGRRPSFGTASSRGTLVGHTASRMVNRLDDDEDDHTARGSGGGGGAPPAAASRRRGGSGAVSASASAGSGELSSLEDRIAMLEELIEVAAYNRELLGADATARELAAVVRGAEAKLLARIEAALTGEGSASSGGFDLETLLLLNDRLHNVLQCYDDVMAGKVVAPPSLSGEGAAVAAAVAASAQGTQGQGQGWQATRTTQLSSPGPAASSSTNATAADRDRQRGAGGSRSRTGTASLAAADGLEADLLSLSLSLGASGSGTGSASGSGGRHSPAPAAAPAPAASRSRTSSNVTAATAAAAARPVPAAAAATASFDPFDPFSSGPAPAPAAVTQPAAAPAAAAVRTSGSGGGLHLQLNIGAAPSGAGGGGGGGAAASAGNVKAPRLAPPRAGGPVIAHSTTATAPAPAPAADLLDVFASPVAATSSISPFSTAPAAAPAAQAAPLTKAPEAFNPFATPQRAASATAAAPAAAMSAAVASPADPFAYLAPALSGLSGGVQLGGGGATAAAPMHVAQPLSMMPHHTAPAAQPAAAPAPFDPFGSPAPAFKPGFNPFA